MSNGNVVVLCPGQGAQVVGMGRAWAQASPAAKAVFDEADATLGDSLGAPLSRLCFVGPVETLNRTNVSQPAIYTCSIACFRGLQERAQLGTVVAAAGLSLGEYTALHLAGVFNFANGLRLVATRGRLMQEAAEQASGSMVALIGADETQAQSVCDRTLEALPGQVLVCANYNAPGQIVLSGHATACTRAIEVATGLGLRATQLTVAGAFHSALMQPAADRMSQALAQTPLARPSVPVWSNVTAQPHEPGNGELLRRMLVQQIVSPVRWSQSCQDLLRNVPSADLHEMAPGSVLRGLMRRIDKTARVTNHEEP